MNNHARLPKNKPSAPRLWKVCAGYFFLCAGLIIEFCVLSQWVPDSNYWRPQITQFGLVSIWIGMLFFQTRKTYFSVISSLILLFSLAGFADNLIFDVDQPSNRDPKFVIHGLFCFAWIIAFTVQADLVRTGRLGLHKKIGIAGFLAAIGFAISTTYLFYVLWIPWGEMTNRVQFNRMALPSFVVMIVMAWIYLKRPECHKRMILMGTLYLMHPILDRAAGGFWIGGAVPMSFVIWLGLFASLFAYDWYVAKKIHPVTYLGSAWFSIVWGVAMLT